VSDHEIYVAAFGEPVAAHISKLMIMRTRQTYKARAERVKARFARLRKRKEEKRLAAPALDYPLIRIPGALVGSITLRNAKFDTVTAIELREPTRGRSDQFAVTVNGVAWPKHGRAVGLSAIRKAISI